MHTEQRSHPTRFPITRWSLVCDVRGLDEQQRQSALDELCSIYWEPVYTFVLKSGTQEPEAQDLTQGFFLDFLARDSFEQVQEGQGRMRNYLLGALKHYLFKAHRKGQAQKRGSGQELLSLDEVDEEGRPINEASSGESPDVLYERKWAEVLFIRAFEHLREFFESRGKLKSFELLKPTLMGQRSEGGYAEIAEQLGESESAIGVTVHRMRQRFRKLLEEEIRETLNDKEDENDFEEELRHLYTVFQNHRSEV